MKAIILATGEEKRFVDQLGAQILPMFSFVNRPLIALAVEKLARGSFRDITVVTLEQGGQLQAYLGSGEQWGVQLHYLPLGQVLGDAGAVRQAAGQGHEPVVVFPGDAIVDLDMEKALAFHQGHGGAVTAVTAAEDAQPTGVYILQPSAIALIPLRKTFRIREDLLPLLAAQGEQPHQYQMPGYWNPLCTAADFLAAQAVYLQSAQENDSESKQLPQIKHPFVAGLQIGRGVWVGRNHAIHPAVKITPPVCIGDNCQIGNDVELGPNVVIGDNVIIDEGATIAEGYVASNTYVGQLVNIERKMADKNKLLDVTSGESSTVIDRFLLTETSPPLLWDRTMRRAIDLLAAFFLVLLSSPLAILVLLLNLVTNKGRLFQRKVIWATRPQRGLVAQTNEPEEIVLGQFATRRGDGRYTPLGQWLERWQLHRLPELWSVVRGDLMLVGVRPIDIAWRDRLVEPWHLQRFTYPAGFTGLWFVQEPFDQDENWIISDVYYVATRSYKEDWRLFWQTLPAWWRRSRTRQIASVITLPPAVEM
jgi:NDP-sugar pyrophosphorylase family protein